MSPTCPDPKVILQAFDTFRATLVASGVEASFEPDERASAMSVAAATTPIYLEAAADAAERGGKLGVVPFDVYEMLTSLAAFSVPPVVLAMAGQPTPVVSAIEDVRVPSGVRAWIFEALSGEPAERPKIRKLLAALG